MSAATRSPTNHPWFRRFLDGCHKRMGDIWQPGEPLTCEIYLMLAGGAGRQKISSSVVGASDGTQFVPVRDVGIKGSIERVHRIVGPTFPHIARVGRKRFVFAGFNSIVDAFPPLVP